MAIPKFKMFSSALLSIGLLIFSASMAFPQATTSSAGTRTAASGQKMKIKGVVTRRDSDTFTVRDMNGTDTIVRLDDRSISKVRQLAACGGKN